MDKPEFLRATRYFAICNKCKKNTGGVIIALEYEPEFICNKCYMKDAEFGN